MLKEARQRHIVALVKLHGSVTTAELSKKFQATRQTIHSDIEELHQRGQLKKVYGGAVLASKIQEAPFHERRDENKQSKDRIGQVAASFIHENDSLFLDVSTTVNAMIPYLQHLDRLTVVTHSIEIAYQLNGFQNFDLHLIGGYVRPNDLACTGAKTLEAFKQIYVDKAFFGLGGISLEAGLTDYHFDDSEIRKVMMKNASETFALFDSSKIGTVTIAQFSELDDMNILISHGVKDKLFLEKIKEKDINFIDSKHYQINKE